MNILIYTFLNLLLQIIRRLLCDEHRDQTNLDSGANIVAKMSIQIIQSESISMH